MNGYFRPTFSDGAQRGDSPLCTVSRRARDLGKSGERGRAPSELSTTYTRLLGKLGISMKNVVIPDWNVVEARSLRACVQRYPGVALFSARHSGLRRNDGSSPHQPGGKIWALAIAGATNTPPQLPLMLSTHSLIFLGRDVYPDLRLKPPTKSHGDPGVQLQCVTLSALSIGPRRNS